MFFIKKFWSRFFAVGCTYSILAFLSTAPPPKKRKKEETHKKSLEDMFVNKRDQSEISPMW
jgi:hypothetical protein